MIKVQIWMSMSLLVHVVFAVEFVHEPHVHENEHDEHVDGALLGEPEAELEAEKAELVEPVDKEDAGPERDQEADREQNGEIAEIFLPIGVHGREYTESRRMGVEPLSIVSNHFQSRTVLRNRDRS